MPHIGALLEAAGSLQEARRTGRELAAVVREGRAVSVATERIFDWSIWVEGQGAVEGASTEGIGYGF
jgi:hypothetical protein